MVNEDERYILEVRKGYIVDSDGLVQGGEWEIVVDELGNPRDFEIYAQAYRVLREVCPATIMLGLNVGKVSVVVLAKRNVKRDK